VQGDAPGTLQMLLQASIRLKQSRLNQEAQTGASEPDMP